MDISFLMTLEAILRHGSFAKAGREIGLTTSAVSLQVKRLEEFFGQPLFDRSSRSARPTSFAREVESATKAAISSIEGLRTRRSLTIAGRLTIGTIRSVQTTTLPRALRALQEHHPQLEIRLAQGDSRELLQQLGAGSIDVAVLVHPATGGSSRYAWCDLAKEPFVLLAPPGSKSHSAEDLLQTHDWIRFDTTLTSGRIARSIVYKMAPQARGSLELGSIDAIVAMVSIGLGVSVVPRPHKPLPAARPVREISLGRYEQERRIAFVCRSADQHDNRLVSAVREAFKTVYASTDSMITATSDRRL